MCRPPIRPGLLAPEHPEGQFLSTEVETNINPVLGLCRTAGTRLPWDPWLPGASKWLGGPLGRQDLPPPPGREPLIIQAWGCVHSNTGLLVRTYSPMLRPSESIPWEGTGTHRPELSKAQRTIAEPLARGTRVFPSSFTKRAGERNSAGPSIQPRPTSRKTACAPASSEEKAELSTGRDPNVQRQK